MKFRLIASALFLVVVIGLVAMKPPAAPTPVEAPHTQQQPKPTGHPVN